MVSRYIVSFFHGMASRIEATWGIKKEFRLKVFFLALSFFFLTACQAIWRPIKTAVFASIVGPKYIPDAKILLLFPLIILIFLYSKLVDWLRRHHLFYWFTISHGLAGIIIFYFLSHPVYGIANTAKGTHRIFGWVFYFFMESFGAFMSAVFWSFANSINKPKDAKNYYGLLVVGSKIGGILGAATAYIFISHLGFATTAIVPAFVLVGSFLLFAAGGAIYLLMKHVPGYLMHGYEAAYQYEKKREKQKETPWQAIKNAAEGLIVIAKNPYVLGIFGFILSYEVIIVIVDYLVVIEAASYHTTPAMLTAFYANYMLIMHSIGLLIALFGTAPIQRFLGIRVSLFIGPVASIVSLILIFLFPSLSMLFYSLVTLRALNYGLNHPAREALFIPTTKAIKFKAKAWTDAFGSRISKASGSLLNKYVLFAFIKRSALLCLSVTSCWVIIGYLLGKTYNDAIVQNKVIGAEEES